MTTRNTEEYYQHLAEKWLSGTITAVEEQEFTNWYNQNQDAPLNIPSAIAGSDQEMHDRILHKIRAEIKTASPGKSMSISRYVLAACLVLVMASIFMYFINQESAQKSALVTQGDFPSGRNTANLTLADGSVISLDDVGNGKIVEQAGIAVVKEADGLLTYRVKEGGKFAKEQFNTISTPLGGQYKIILPDGTKVWLNAGSSLKYPTSFQGKQRLVTLFGEGYFEVAKDKNMPFKVKTSNQEITVLGTHFNINAYKDEPDVKTTLVEGAVKVLATDLNQTGSGVPVVLAPGEQSVLSKNNRLSVRSVNVAAETAWKSGVFSFQNTDIHVVLRQFSRWYNVEIEFEGEVPDVKLWGEMDRNVSATEALEMLHYFNLKYKVIQDGKTKKIMISK